MKRLIVLPLLLLLMLGHGQVAQEIRREFPVGEDYDNFSIAPMGELGVVVFGSDKLNYSTRRWKFLLLDTDFKNVDSVSIDLPQQLYHMTHLVEKDRLTILFANTKRKVFRMVILDAGQMTIRDFSGNLPSKSRLMEMVQCGQTIYISLYQGKKLMLMAVNTTTGRSKLHPIKVAGAKRLAMEGMEVPRGHQQALLYVGYYGGGRNYLMQVQLWNEEGSMDEVINLSNPSDKNLTAITGTVLGSDHFIFVGSYSNRSATLSTGFFVAEVENGKRSYIEYHNYMDLNNFTNYLPKRQQAKVDRKKERASSRGKSLSYEFRMVGHNIVHINGRYYFLAEFFYPTYRTETTYTANGGTSTRTVFDGYQYTHSSLICFDEQGQKLWDNTFEMWVPYKPMTVVRFMSMRADSEGRVDLAYSSRSSVYAKSFDQNGKVLHQRTSSGLDTGGEDEKVRRSFSWMTYWYGDSFIAYGQQVIKDKGKSLGNRSRRVFFINKISI